MKVTKRFKLFSDKKALQQILVKMELIEMGMQQIFYMIEL